MGFFDRFRRRPQDVLPPKEIEKGSSKEPKVVVGATDTTDEERKDLQSYNNQNITFSGELMGYNYDSILRNKQSNINSLYQLADYYVDADALVRGIVRHVYVPYTLGSSWVLTGATQKTRQIYEDYYKAIRLREKLCSFILEYWKYANVFVYILNGVPITLPVTKCRIGNVSLNGDPIVDFDCQSIYNEWRAKNYAVRENWIKDNHLEVYFKGYPPEVQEGLNHGVQYVQLNPKYTKVLQAEKESWQRYAIPFIAACLPSLAKKELINKYEIAQVNLGIHSFVHVPYGDEKKGADMLPDGNQLREVRSIFSKAMNGFPLAVTNQLAKPSVVQPDLDNLFQFDKYKDVNNDILSAGGVSGILVSGISEDGSTFAQAQVSMQAAAARIEACRDEICELMNKINVCIQEELAEKHRYNVKQVPEFHFLPLDMSGKKALREACKDLWLQGVVSTKTMLDMQGYSIEREKALREKEAQDGTDEILLPRALTNEKAAMPEGQQETPVDVTPEEMNLEEKDPGGRPEMTDEERHSDPDGAARGKLPKPSNEDGSMGDEGIG